MAVYFALNALHAIYGVYVASKAKLQVFFEEIELDMSAAAQVARRAKFEGIFPKIRDELIEYFAGQGVPQDAVEWYRNVRASPLVIHWLTTYFVLLESRVQYSWW